MTEQEIIDYNKYRFSGYAPPLVKLDETGSAYWVVGVHPYYKNQPLYWSKGVQFSAPSRTNTVNNQVNFIDNGSSNGSCSGCKLFSMMKI